MNKVLYSDNFLTIEINTNEMVKVGDFPNTTIIRDFGFICDCSRNWNILSIPVAEYVANKLNKFNMLNDTLGRNLINVLNY